MLKCSFWLSFVLGSLGCATPQGSSTPIPGERADFDAELGRLRESVSKLENRLGHLETDIEASSSEDELTVMTIDAVGWDSEMGFTSGVTNAHKPVLLCHVVEWRDYPKMKRFTRLADQDFVLDADGQPSISAKMAVGGVCDDSGSSRFVVLIPSEKLQSRVRYTLRAQNENERYRWQVADGLTVVQAH